MITKFFLIFNKKTTENVRKIKKGNSPIVLSVINIAVISKRKNILYIFAKCSFFC